MSTGDVLRDPNAAGIRVHLSGDVAGRETLPATRSVMSADVRTPLVSVVLTSHNYATYVCQAIQSVADQSYDKIECVIVDDCSTDGSVDTIAAFLGRLDDPRFRLIPLQTNVGHLGAIKTGLEKTTGEFVASIDADDLWMPDFVEAHVAAHLNASFSAGISASDTVQIDENGTVLEGTYYSLAKERTDHPGKLTRIPIAAVPKVASNSIAFAASPGPYVFYTDRQFHGWHYVAMSAMMFRRAMLDMIVPDNASSLKISADYYLAIFSHWVAGSLTIGQAHSYFRRHGKNNFSTNRVIGGPYPPGSFTRAMQQSADEAIGHHLIDNVDRLAPILGLQFYAKTLRRIFGRKRLYEAVRRSPALRLYFGKGSETRFRLKYGLLYRYLRNR